MTAAAACTVYRVTTVKHGGVVTHVAVDGGMGDNLEVSLYGQRFEATLVDRVGGGADVTVVGRHCESGDQLIDVVPLDDPAVGDLLAVPVTGGAYCYTMSNQYNGGRAGFQWSSPRTATPDSLCAATPGPTWWPATCESVRRGQRRCVVGLVEVCLLAADEEGQCGADQAHDHGDEEDRAVLHGECGAVALGFASDLGGQAVAARGWAAWRGSG